MRIEFFLMIMLFSFQVFSAESVMLPSIDELLKSVQAQSVSAGVAASPTGGPKILKSICAEWSHAGTRQQAIQCIQTEASLYESVPVFLIEYCDPFSFYQALFVGTNKLIIHIKFSSDSEKRPISKTILSPSTKVMDGLYERAKNIASLNGDINSIAYDNRNIVFLTVWESPERCKTLPFFAYPYNPNWAYGDESEIKYALKIRDINNLFSEIKDLFSNNYESHKPYKK